MNNVTFTDFHFCGGSGGAALGMSRSSAKVGSFIATMECLGGIDSDPSACRDFKNLVGVEQSCLDLFDRQMYIDFHGKEPPADWHEVTIEDVRKAAQYRSPDIVVLSAPCKGYSNLLSKQRADTPKYKALNRLVLRCIHLAIAAWEENPPSLFLIENVPAITTKGRALLDQVNSLFFHAGYAARETTHDAGEIGGLGQRRKRFLMVARHRVKVPALLYEPPIRPLRSVVDVIGPMPIPGSALGGPMHRLPSLDPMTWLRLALVPAGKDGRALKNIDLASVFLEQRNNPGRRISVGDWLNNRPIKENNRDWGGGPLGVLHLDQPAGTVTGNGRATTGAFSVADKVHWANAGHYGVLPWWVTGPCVTGSASCDNGRNSVADPRTVATSQEQVIISADGTWHRPLTILEMAALQGFDWQDGAGVPLCLDSKNKAKWQEHIGNAIPIPSAEAIGSEMLRTLLMSKLGKTFNLSATKVWVRPVALALSVDGGIYETR